ncbi:SusC/RagA family TonB-linked outer membrane protein [Echinicola sp. CAU 1574]|uniref:SusC/RagA family TonB-linked outer membrane protein n=1 Tax=Echinicola arenosa TaxID=2774144 RepID=A0ABR9AK33_9BACT|nr:SusC/RagA family TonB-linked outer membrane protein [Echinicola arenosa]MBD8489180.1 SusC/RagA family TonB-linked outer membrane protein [Echinicola arenosa]
MKHLLLAIILLWGLFGSLHAQTAYPVKGQVLEAIKELPLSGALIRVAGTETATVTDEKGNYGFQLAKGSYSLEISYLGFRSQTLEISVPLDKEPVTFLVEEGLSMDAVDVVSTGYQQLPRERSTGSFVQLDEKLLQRRVSTDLMDRIEDIAPGVLFNRDARSGNDPISIRGRSTLFANTQPLVVVDGFPYDGPLQNINPNDVESITILKDAAAASIWGARAGNGVIVVTTKKGTYGRPLSVSLTSNVTVLEKPDLFYEPQMDIGEFIEVERSLYDNGFYSSRINSSSKTPLSPVVEALYAAETGMISQQEADDKIAAYKNRDIRRDMEKHFLRPAVRQQYNLGLSGGERYQRYALSVGWDKNSASIRENDNGRFTLKGDMGWKLLKDKLEVGTGIYLTGSSVQNGTQLPSGSPYESLVDAQGRRAALIRDYNLRFVEQAEQAGLLNWQYVPLDEIGLVSDLSRSTDIRLNTNIKVNLSRNWKAAVSYQYWQNRSETRTNYPLASYFARNMVNRYSQLNGEGNWEYPVPMGGILDLGNGRDDSHTFRARTDYNQSWGLHRLDALAGFELRDWEGIADQRRYYGYDDGMGLSVPVNLVDRFPLYHNNSQTTIPGNDGHSGLTDRFVSYFANVAYSFDNRLHLTGSVRKDASNLFGVDTNLKGVPLWSAGTGWIISEEGFYGAAWMPYLKLRTTFGYNGNVDKSLSSLTTASYFISRSSAPVPGIRSATIINPPNPSLRWERIGIWNMGVDFGSKNDWIEGSVEYYIKNGRDLIGETRFPPSSGVTSFTGNYAETRTSGIDLNLSTLNLDGPFTWRTNLIFSHLNEEVTAYGIPSTTGQYLGLGTAPMEGRPLFSIYSLRWGGLDPDTGDPLGYVDGELSDNYNSLRSGTVPEELVYHGPARPTTFGALRNGFEWKGFSLSLNISFRLGYYYRRQSVNYYDLLNGRITHSDHALRWQQPGDEAHTDIPSMPSSSNSSRNYFYQFSEPLVEKGDHIRLQDIRLGYRFEKRRMPSLPFQSAELYTYINNVGMIWKASDDPLDPDFRTSKPLKSIALGVKIDF